MAVTVLCPACDSELTAPAAAGAMQCPTCWARVPLDTARRKPTDTPPPKGPAPADDVPTARPAATPPRAKRVPDRKVRSQRVDAPAKSGGWVWAVVLVMVLTGGGAGVGLLFINKPAANNTFASVTISTRTPPVAPPVEDEWILVAVPEGATLLAPGPTTKKSIIAGGESGVRHTAADGNTTADVFVFDLKSDRRADRHEFLGSLFGVPGERVVRQGVRVIAGGDAVEYTASGDDGFDHAALVIGRFGRWFVFHIRWKPEDDPKEKRKAAFLSKAAVAWVRVELPADPPKPKDASRPADTKPTPTPTKPKDTKGEAEPISETWAAIDNKAGFAAVAPKGVRPERLFIEHKRVSLGGQKWQCEDGHCVYHVSYLDLPADIDPDAARLLKPLLPFGLEVGAEADGTAGGRTATVWQLKNWDKVKAKAVTVRCGYRVFTAFVSSRHGKAYGDDPTFTQRADKFTGSLKFTFDPKADDPYAGEPKWVAVPNAVGFSAKVPKGATANKAHDIGGNPKIVGQHYRTEAGGVVYEVFVHDLPAKRTAADVTKDLLGFDKLVAGPTEVRGADGRRWTTYELGRPERPVLFRTATVGGRVLSLRVYPEPSGDDRAGAREFRDKAARFFDQFTAND